MKTILVPVDFSENAEKAIEAAKLVASKIDAQLLFLHVFQPYVADAALPMTISSLASYQELEDGYKKQLETYAADAKRDGFSADSIWETGGPHEAIIKRAQQFSVDLIIVGRTGKGGFFDRLIGSAATGIALKAPCPVLVIPPQVLSPLNFGNIVYATQLEYDETDILREVVQLTTQFSAKLSLIKISSLEQPDIQPDKQYIAQITEELAIPAEDITIRKGGGVLDGIERYCDEVKAGLLIVSTRERGFLEQFIINPSTTKKLVVDTHVPLLVYHLK
jgi:nucleotide-binding universal stress UspA family protein